MNGSCWRDDEQGFFFPEDETMIEPVLPAQLNFSKSHRRSTSLHKQVKPRISTCRGNLELVLDRSAQQNGLTSSRYPTNSPEKMSSYHSTNLQEHVRSKGPKKISREDIVLQLQDEYVAKLKQYLIGTTNRPIYYQQAQLRSTFSYMGMLAAECRGNNFIQHKLNRELRGKIQAKASEKLMRKVPYASMMAGQEDDLMQVTFQGCFESSNLALVQQMSLNQFDLYTRIDTNTRGHQNWYSFRLKCKEKRVLKLNICNLQREVTLYPKGLRPYVSVAGGSWEPAGTDIYYSHSECGLQDRRHFKLSFKLEVKPNLEYQVAMLPLYTYSQMLQHIDKLEQLGRLKLQCLSYTLAGLAIPLLTFELPSQYPKNVVLISGRVHPGQTVSSYIMHGLIEQLASLVSNNSQLLTTTTFKVVPMLNPDGVVFGNFRTSLLGVDLNRSFHRQEQMLYPEVVALKRLGLQLKDRHKSKVVCFMDIHGHSTKKNMFVYGPDYPISVKEHELCRLLPKLLENHCKCFRYGSCSFKLEQCKLNTARGHFLRHLKVMAFTLQSSYGLCDEQGAVRLLKVDDYLQCGAAIVAAIAQYVGSQLESSMDQTEEHASHQADIAQKRRQKLLKQLKASLRFTQQIINGYRIGRQHNSDSEDDQQDLTPKQRSKVQKRLIMSLLPPIASYLPRMVQKQSVLYPMGSPQLWGDAKRDELRLKLIQHRKGSYMRITPARRQTIIRHLERLSMIEPNIRGLKLSYHN